MSEQTTATTTEKIEREVTISDDGEHVEETITTETEVSLSDELVPVEVEPYQEDDENVEELHAELVTIAAQLSVEVESLRERILVLEAANQVQAEEKVTEQAQDNTAPVVSPAPSQPSEPVVSPVADSTPAESATPTGQTVISQPKDTAEKPKRKHAGILW